ncbi:MAG: hypothetical protein CFK49_09180 [Armatimonadetes bacterium JP3_11]|jgi:hypothetical protein|nr:MAG: hypothetical protein CFK48_08005 [Armatimonadetes bacterium CP1_7O]OYT74274.1 MAG: hypothetical protein CFK49_09180 [Armatimonadetes bacterium JP3_11]RMH10220.1 MAG: hypothetical protein D6697_01740 [Armatimonadota bacterium]
MTTQALAVVEEPNEAGAYAELWLEAVYLKANQARLQANGVHVPTASRTAERMWQSHFGANYTMCAFVLP